MTTTSPPQGEHSDTDVITENFPDCLKCYCCKLYKTVPEFQFIKKTQKVFKVCQECNRSKALKHYHEHRLTILESKKTYRLDKIKCSCGCDVQTRNIIQHTKSVKHNKRLAMMVSSVSPIGASVRV